MMELHDETPDPVLVQAGWEVLSRDGESLGEVLGADRVRFLVREDDHATRRLEIPTDLVVEQEPAEMRARIAIDANEVSAEHAAITRIPRERS